MCFCHVPMLLNSYNMPLECVSGEIGGFLIGVYCALNLCYVAAFLGRFAPCYRMIYSFAVKKP